jgi:GNAT superfamily N-acetyltransferase
MTLTTREVAGKADSREFVELAYRLNAADPNWVPPLRNEVRGLLDPNENPWFEHAEAALFLAERGGRPVGRISAQVDRLVLEAPPEQGMGPGTGQWGMLEAEDGESTAALLQAAEQWLRRRGMTRSLGPFSLSIWDEPGLLVRGNDHPPSVMMGHHNPAYGAWVEGAGYKGVKDLHTYEIDVRGPMSELVQRIVASGERNSRVRIRKVNKKRFHEEAAIILDILNDAWSGSWGFIPLTDAEIAYGGKKLKPIVYEDLIRVAELDGEPVAFMMTLPDINELIRDLGGSLFPLGWAKLILRLRNPRTRTMRVPLMGVVKRLQSTRLASQLAFMLVEHTRRDAVKNFGVVRGEFGWILDDNVGMNSMAEAISGHINRIYRIYEKPL